MMISGTQKPERIALIWRVAPIPPMPFMTRSISTMSGGDSA